MCNECNKNIGYQCNEIWEELFEHGPDFYYEHYILLHVPMLYRYICAKVLIKDDAKDLLQEALAKSYRALKNYYVLKQKHRVIHPSPWLKRIVHNVIYDYALRNRPIWYLSAIEDSLLDIEDPSLRPDQIVESKETLQELYNNIRILPERYQIAIYLT